MPQLDVLTYPSQIFWLLVTFSVLYLFTSFYFMPVISSITKLRASKVTKDLVTAEVSIEKYKALQSEIEAILNEAKAVSHQIRVESTIRSHEIVESRFAESESEIDRRIAAEIARLNTLRGELKANLPSLTQELSKVVFNVVLTTYDGMNKVH
ncbi:hypothetical protein EDM53_05390 [Rickettsiales endosymbiont of Peranema trichophorum]|uniref:F0F1 ATP synthase subunit B family protein n=1 Tax=Rickettsiales endosymbiont of Peranema trichophorum TaxID=2486577 RepID=UPI00102364E0|nr:hypothetical protein [Rickettsiales endosymbiont of Peranema trichophorum]RZI45390.1 hypothetical protein EDM53_05390 [Rickettsiales endosymbiont of Peranema trichophorum]